MSTVRVVVADDNELAREATRTILAKDPQFHVVAEAVDGYDALDQVERHRPDLVLMDVNMPRCDGLVATRLIKQRQPHVTVVILTVSNDAGDLFTAIQSGAQGYLVKHVNPRDWITYLRAVVDDKPALSADMARRLLAPFGPAGGDGGQQLSVATVDIALTEREQEVTALVAQAYTDRQIAERLGISLYTVKNHLRNIRTKLGAANRVELALFARSQSGPFGPDST